MEEDNRELKERVRCEIEAEFRQTRNQAKTPCLVVDLSECGAGLDMPEDVLLSGQFYLSMPLMEGMADERLVELRWRNGRSAGVRFV